MEEKQRKQRKRETAEERCARKDGDARARLADAEANDEAADAMVKRSIEGFGA